MSRSLLGRWRRAEARRAARPGTAVTVPATPLELLERSLSAVDGAPDAWQVSALSSSAARMVVVSGRQLGKGSVAAARALHMAATVPGVLVLVVSASERQARIVLARIRGMLPYVGPAAAGVEDSQTEVRFPSGSSIVVLPSTSTSLRGWTAHLLVLDEAAYIARTSWESVVPTVAATGGAILALTSAGAPAGWLYDVWADADGAYPEWTRLAIRADQVPRIDRVFLEAERRRLPAAVFAREYECEFTGSDAGVFDPELLAQAFGSVDQAHSVGFDFGALDLSTVLLGGGGGQDA